MKEERFYQNYIINNPLPVCKSCQSDKHLLLKKRYRCKSCLKEYPLCAYTRLDKTHIPITSWLEIISRYSERSYTARNLSDILDVRYGTLLKVLKTLRIENSIWVDQQILAGEVEVDETFLGFNKGHGRGSHPIILLLCEKTGEKRTLAIQVLDTKRETLEKAIVKHIEKGSTVITDAHKGYNGLSLLGYKHTIHNIQATGVKAHTVLPVVHSRAAHLKTFFKQFVKPPKDSKLVLYLSEYSWRQSFNKTSKTKREKHLLDMLMKRKSDK